VAIQQELAAQWLRPGRIHVGEGIVGSSGSPAMPNIAARIESFAAPER
jgi:hypothetical protein